MTPSDYDIDVDQRRASPSDVVAAFDQNVKTVLSLSELDRGLLEWAIKVVEERDERLLKSGIDNPRILAGTTLDSLKNVRQNDSLRPGFQALVDQSVVLLASYFSSALSELFKVATATALAGTPTDHLRDLPLKLSVGELAGLESDLPNVLPDLVAETPGISFQDTKSVARTFSQFFAVDIPVDEITNDVSAGLAFRHVLVHSGGVVDRSCVRQLARATPRSLRPHLRAGQNVAFTSEEITALAKAMATYVRRLATLLEDV